MRSESSRFAGVVIIAGIVTLIVAALIIWIVADDDDGGDQGPTLVTVGQVATERVGRPFIGDDVVVSGDVSEIFGPRSFVIGRDFESAEDLLVVTRTPIAAVGTVTRSRPVLEGDLVQVEGPLRTFERRRFEDLVQVTLPAVLNGEREEPAVVAERVTVTPRLFPVNTADSTKAIRDRPTSYLDAVTAVSGEVTRVFGNDAFVLDDRLLAINATGLVLPRVGRRVRVVGPVRRFDPDQLRQLEATDIPDRPPTGPRLTLVARQLRPPPGQDSP